ncbi:MAG: hypothetical protein RL497_2724 [Pseudomonadota bacterium]|jgi:hypothetical protein
MQQVNLYLTELRPKFDPFAARSLLVVVGGFVLIMAFWTAFSQSRVRQMQIDLDSATADVASEEAKLTRLKALGKPGDKTQLEESASQVRVAIDNRVYIKRLISDNAFGNDKGFSVLMTALAKYALKDLFLSEFGLGAGGRNLYLHGMTTRVDAVPEYIKALQQDAALANSNPGVLKLTKNSSGQIEFSFGEWDEKVMGGFSEPSNALSNGQSR